MLKLENISAGYGFLQVLTDISLHVDKGEFVTVIGPNGAGKSTLMETIFNLTTLHSGKLLYENEEISGLDPSKLTPRGIAYVPQEHNIFPTLTVMENLVLGAFHNRGRQEQNLVEVFARFPRLEERQQQKGGTLSGGERQMLAVSCALMSEPMLLLLDEPSGGLAPLIVAELFEKIAEIQKEEDVAILLVEQNAQKALQYAERGYVLQSGKIQLEGSADELLGNTAVIESYLGV